MTAEDVQRQPQLLLQVLDRHVVFGNRGFVLGDDGVVLGELGCVATHLGVQRREGHSRWGTSARRLAPSGSSSPRCLTRPPRPPCEPRARASSTVRASSGSSVGLNSEPAHRPNTIHVLLPFGRARSPSFGVALAHSTASRPSAGMKVRARAAVILVLWSATFRPFVCFGRGRSSVIDSILGRTAGFGVRKNRNGRAQSPRRLELLAVAGVAASWVAAVPALIDRPQGGTNVAPRR